eukprot:1141864-Pelagomonas_calceolata.AAC.2
MRRPLGSITLEICVKALAYVFMTTGDHSRCHSSTCFWQEPPGLRASMISSARISSARRASYAGALSLPKAMEVFEQQIRAELRTWTIFTRHLHWREPPISNLQATEIANEDAIFFILL